MDAQMTIKAAVVRKPGGPFELTELTLDPPRADEVLVRVVSVGICGTDLEFAGMLTPPAVLGHEGAGVVESVGSDVDDLEPGDKVAMSFASCGECRQCVADAPAYCQHFWTYNFIGTRPDGTSALHADGAAVTGHFLGQSSFATHVVARRSSVVRVDPETDLAMLGPFGCGFQTGAGGVLNVLAPEPGSSIAVFGVGGVGAAAIMAAQVAGCSTILAVDINADKLSQALSLGATHTLRSDSDDLAREIDTIAPGGLQYSIDTTGRADVVRTAVEALRPLGHCGVIGVGPSPEMSFEWRTILNGRTVTGITAGGSVPQRFIPELLALHRDGRFPVDTLLTYFPFDAINDAVAAVRSGSVGKAVLLMGDTLP